MKKLKLFLTLAILLFILIINFGCSNNASHNIELLNKTDSLNFAESIYKKYAVKKPLTLTFKNYKGLTPSEPVSWDIIKQYQENYDRNPQLVRPDGVPYKGFILDGGSFTAFKNNTSCNQLYFRLGMNEHDEYTIMVLPMDRSGKVLQVERRALGQDLNHDHLDPCPDVCPTNMDY
ncbi:MAG: hypothetical protein ABJA78_11545 [Ferruginibacter sp.]